MEFTLNQNNLKVPISILVIKFITALILLLKKFKAKFPVDTDLNHNEGN